MRDNKIDQNPHYDHNIDPIEQSEGALIFESEAVRSL